MRARRRASRAAPKPRPSYISQTAAPERFRREIGEGDPPRRELGVDLRGLERSGRGAAVRRRSLVAGLADVLDEAVALEIHPRQPVRTLRVPARDAHEVVLHAERLGVLRDAVRDHDRDRSQHELAEHHVMHDPLPVAEVAPGEHIGELRPARAARAPGSRPRHR